jgi:site-specific recombinase XerD
MANKSLGHWVKRAGIEKHITWHCGRHTFATLVLEGGASVPVVASLLGHSSIQMTQKYTRARDAAKKAAMESLPKI